MVNQTSSMDSRLASIMNWITFVLLCILTVIIRKRSNSVSIYVCPVLTFLVIYHMTFHAFPRRPEIETPVQVQLDSELPAEKI